MQISRLEWELYAKQFPGTTSSLTATTPTGSSTAVSPLIEISGPSPDLPIAQQHHPHGGKALTKTESLLTDLLSFGGTPPQNAPSAKAILQRPLSFINKLFEGSVSGPSSDSSSTNHSPVHSRQSTVNNLYPAQATTTTANTTTTTTTTPQPPLIQAQQPPQFERELGEREKEILQDYEMQLAMALSLSIAEEERKRQFD
jgi:hypothetical protein